MTTLELAAPGWPGHEEYEKLYGIVDPEAIAAAAEAVRVEKYETDSGLRVVKAVHDHLDYNRQGALLLGVPEHNFESPLGGHNRDALEQIEAWLDQPRPLLVVEGGIPRDSEGLTLDEMVARFADRGVAAWLAREHRRAPMRSAEPPLNGYRSTLEATRELAKQHPEYGLTDQHVREYFLGRLLPQYVAERQLKIQQGRADYPPLGAFLQKGLEPLEGRDVLKPKPELSLDAEVRKLGESLKKYGGDQYIRDGKILLDEPGLREFMVEHTTIVNLPPDPAEWSPYQHVAYQCNYRVRRGAFLHAVTQPLKALFSPGYITYKGHIKALEDAVIEAVVLHTASRSSEPRILVPPGYREADRIFEENPRLVEFVNARANMANRGLIERLAVRNRGKKPPLTYADTVQDPELMHLFVEGSHVHQLEDGWPMSELWKGGREFVANMLRRGGDMLDVDSSNGLFLSTMIDKASVQKPIRPFGVDTNGWEVRAAQELFPDHPGHFARANIFEVENPGNLSDAFPEQFDTIYWGVRSDQGTFEPGTQLTDLLQKLATWTKPGGQLILGFDTMDKHHKAALEALGLRPQRTMEGRGIESIWELDPTHVTVVLSRLQAPTLVAGAV